MDLIERQRIIHPPAPFYQPRGLPIQQYFDKGANPFFVKDC
jgi:hypothetical protein